MPTDDCARADRLAVRPDYVDSAAFERPDWGRGPGRPPEETDLPRQDRRGNAPGEFDSPADVATYRHPDGSLSIFVADWGNHRVQRFDGDGNFVTEWPVEFPAGIAVDARGNVYVNVRRDPSRFHVFTGDGAPIATQVYGDDQSGSRPRMRGIAVDGDCNVYVTDPAREGLPTRNRESRILKFTPDDGVRICRAPEEVDE